MEQLKFKSSEILISRIKENLSSYDSAGIVDSGKFYAYIKKELQLLGNYIYQDATEVIEVKNGKVLLPEDFIKLYCVYSLNGTTGDYKTSGVQSDKVYQVETSITHKNENLCEDVCETETDIVRVRTTLETNVKSSFNGSNMLRYSGRVSTELCDEESPNFYSKNTQEFNIDDNYIYTNFNKGKVILQYLSFPYDEDGYPMIPQEPKLENAIEMFIMFKTFEYFYTNDIINNALQKMQYYKEEYRMAHKSALNYVKMPTYQDSIDTAYREVRNRFKIFELKRNGRYPYSTPNRDAERSRQY